MTETTSKPSGMRPWVRVLLVASLTANLAVAGLAVGAAIRVGGDRHEKARPPMPLGAQLYRALPREDKDLLRKRDRETREERTARRMAETAELDAALRAVPFDPERVSDFVIRDAVRQDTFERDMRQAWMGRIVAMSDEDRAAYADRLQELMQGHDHHDGPPSKAPPKPADP